MRSGRVPRYLRQREKNRTDRAIVIINGKRHNLGAYGSEESKRKYAELLKCQSVGTKGETFPTSSGSVKAFHTSPPTITQLIVAYLHYVTNRFGEDPTGQLYHHRAAIKLLRAECGSMLAANFGPKAFRKVRDAMIAKDWSRRYIKDQCARVRQFVEWCVSEEYVGGDVLTAIRAVKGLRRGEAREGRTVKPVDAGTIKATLPHLPPAVRDMVEIQRLTGMRSGELVIMRPADVRRPQSAGTQFLTGVEMSTENVWLYRPARHKTQHHGKTRVIAIGPRAQTILAPYLLRMPEERCFNYTPQSYCRAVKRACDRAGIPRWTPHQLRHSAATAARQVAGLDGAQAMLGHSNANVTQIYAELATEKAAELALKIG